MDASMPAVTISTTTAASAHPPPSGSANRLAPAAAGANTVKQISGASLRSASPAAAGMSCCRHIARNPARR